MDNDLRISRTLNTVVGKMGYVQERKGELYGVELELEGRNVAMEGVPTKGWKREKDGSLRGESIEYVFSTPCGYDEATARVRTLFEAFKKNAVKIKNSYRTSTHVHINFSDRKIREIINFFVLFTILEELLEIYCGEGREGNLFCLPSRDVEGIVNMLEKAVMNRGDLAEFGEDVRYCAINLAAINKFGTIEIRTMRGADNQEMVLDWMDILHQMYDFAINKMTTPARLIESLSILGDEGFINQVFNRATAKKLMATWGGRGLHASLYEGARLVQVLSYRLDEAYQRPFDEVEVHHDPNDQILVYVDGVMVSVPMYPILGDRVEVVGGRGPTILEFFPNFHWQDINRGSWCFMYTRDGVKYNDRMMREYKVRHTEHFVEQEQRAAPAPALPQYIISPDGRVKYTVNGPYHDGDSPQGVPHLVYCVEENFFYDENNDMWFNWCTEQGILLEIHPDNE